MLAPAPYFHVFFRCLEILHHLLSVESLLPAAPVATSADDSGGGGGESEAPLSPPPLPDALPIECAAATFLTAMHIALSDPPPPGQILRLTLPRRDDYQLAALPTIATDVPRGGSAELPPTLAHGDDFAEVQIPPTLAPEGVLQALL